MRRKTGVLFIFLLMAVAVQAQENRISADSPATRTARQRGVPGTAQHAREVKDTATVPSYPSFVLKSFDNRQDFVHYLLTNNRLFKGIDHPQMRLMSFRASRMPGHINKAVLFYLLLGVCFLLALIRLGFRKYFTDLFRAFFSPTLSQRQLKDQLHQTPFPAFALNVFFTVSLGVYLYLVLLKTQYLSLESPLYLVAFFILLMMLIYLLKYVILRVGGWLFGYHELMDNYIFTLFLINKILGIGLLPFSLILAFSPTRLSGVFFNLSIIFIGLLLVYRYIRVFPFVKSQAAFSKFHFFLYLCGFEIAPVLIIAKLTLIWLNGA